MCSKCLHGQNLSEECIIPSSLMDVMHIGKSPGVQESGELGGIPREPGKQGLDVIWRVGQLLGMLRMSADAAPAEAHQSGTFRVCSANTYQITSKIPLAGARLIA